MEHGGRIQTQGGGIEDSEPWDRATPLPASEGHAMLDRLKGRIGEREVELREAAFDKAHRFIEAVSQFGGISQAIKKSWPSPPRRDPRRVDIEVHRGRAFVP